GRRYARSTSPSTRRCENPTERGGSGWYREAGNPWSRAAGRYAAGQDGRGVPLSQAEGRGFEAHRPLNKGPGNRPFFVCRRLGLVPQHETEELRQPALIAATPWLLVAGPPR